MPSAITGLRTPEKKERARGESAQTEDEIELTLEVNVPRVDSPKIIKTASSRDLSTSFATFCRDMRLVEKETTSDGLSCWLASTGLVKGTNLRQERAEVALHLRLVWESTVDEEQRCRGYLQDFIRLDVLKAHVDVLGTPRTVKADMEACNRKFDELVTEIATFNKACGQVHMTLLAILYNCAFVVCNKETRVVSFITGLPSRHLPLSRSATFDFHEWGALHAHLMTLCEPVHFVSYDGTDGGDSDCHYNMMELELGLSEQALEQFQVYRERMLLFDFKLKHVGWTEEVNEAVSDERLATLEQASVACTGSPFEVRI